MKNKVIKFRVTEAEYRHIKSAATGYHSLSNYIRTAISQHNDRQARQRFELMDALYTIQRDHDARLAWCGSNLNQAVHALHLLNTDGKVPYTFLSETLLPAITDTHSMLLAFRTSLDAVIQKTQKV